MKQFTSLLQFDKISTKIKKDANVITFIFISSFWTSELMWLLHYILQELLLVETYLLHHTSLHLNLRGAHTHANHFLCCLHRTNMFIVDSNEKIIDRTKRQHFSFVFGIHYITQTINVKNKVPNQNTIPR